MSHATLEKLVMMANQIGAFFVSQGPGKAVSGIADHIAKFWDPRMREAIIVHVRSGGEGLTPEAKQAIEMLADKAKTA